MTSKEKIVDIKYLIMECYSDNEPLSNSQKASRNCFFKYCDEIKQDLEILEILRKHIFYDKDEYDGIIDMEIIFQDNKDFIKIKEWLYRE